MNDSLWPHECSKPGLPVLHYLPELAQTHVHWVSDAIIPLHPLSPSSPALYISQHPGLFQWIGSSHLVAKALELQLHLQWSFISPSSEYSGSNSFRIDWFDLAVQGTLKSLPKHHNSKTSILWPSAFFMVPLSHSYMTTGKTIALTRGIFVSKWCLRHCLGLSQISLQGAIVF